MTAKLPTNELFNFLRETFADALGILRSPEGLKSLYGVSLYRNAVYLRLTSGATAVSQPSGFLSLLSGKFSAKLVASSLRLQGGKSNRRRLCFRGLLFKAGGGNGFKK